MMILISLFAILVGIGVGLFIRNYILSFPNKLQANTLSYVRALLPQVEIILHNPIGLSSPNKQSLLYLPIIYGLIFPFIILANHWQDAIYLYIYLTLLIMLGLTDYYYKLIDANLCQLLLGLGIFTAWFGIGKVDLENALLSSLVGFVSLYSIFLLAKIITNKECMGTGDYYLFAGLASFFYWHQLPWLLLIASLIGIIYYWLVLLGRANTNHNKHIPFVTCLNIAALIIGYI